MFDHVFDGADQNEVYEILVKPLVDKLFEGYNCTFLASGQTGTGKTYTMGFESSVSIPMWTYQISMLQQYKFSISLFDQVNSEYNGITPRVLSAIFSYQNAITRQVSASFVEVYNDQAFDLLTQNPQGPFISRGTRTYKAKQRSH